MFTTELQIELLFSGIVNLCNKEVLDCKSETTEFNYIVCTTFPPFIRAGLLNSF